MAYLSGYSKYKVLTLTGGASGAQTDFQLKLAVVYEAAMDGEFDDIRFTQADGETLIDAWAELIVTDTSATVLVEFPTTPANTVEQTYYMYYGHASPASDWDGAATFIDYDGFEDGSTVDAGDIFVLGSNYANGAYPHNGSWGIRCPSGGTFQKSQSVGSLSLDATMAATFVYCQTVSGRINSIAVVDSGNDAGGTGGYLKFDGGTIYAINNAAWVSTTETYNASDWKKVEILQGATTYHVRIDNGTLRGPYTNQLAHTIANVDRFWIAGETVYGYFDDFYLSKYAVNPPTYAFGAEQSVPSGGNPYWYYNLLKRRN